MRLRKESTTELLFVGHDPIGGAVALVLCAGVVAVASRANGAAATTALVVAGLLGVASVPGVLRRDSLRFDRVGRRWRRTRGLWPRARATTGTYEALRAVEVQEDPSLHRGKRRVEWEVWLRADAPAARVRLAETADRGTAEAERARFARLLELEGKRAA